MDDFAVARSGEIFQEQYGVDSRGSRGSIGSIGSITDSRIHGQWGHGPGNVEIKIARLLGAIYKLLRKDFNESLISPVAAPAKLRPTRRVAALPAVTPLSPSLALPPSLSSILYYVLSLHRQTCGVDPMCPLRRSSAIFPSISSKWSI